MSLPINLIQFVISGWLLLKIIRFSGTWQEKLGLSFILGSGLQTILYFFSVSKTDYTSPATYLKFTTFLILGLSGIYLILKYLFPVPKTNKINANASTKKDLISHFAWIGILILFLISVIYTTYVPVHTTDSIHLYDFRAKIMYQTQTISAIRQIEHWKIYPPFTSMIHLFLRYSKLKNPSLYWPLMYLSFALIFYSLLKKKTNYRLASIGTLAMYSTPLIYWQSRLDGLTNIPYTIFYSLSVFYAISATEDNKTNYPYLAISILMTYLSVWTRMNEPFWTIPFIIIATTLLFKRRLPIPALFCVVMKPFKRIWTDYASQNYITVKSVGTNITQKLLANSVFSPNTLLNIVFQLFNTLKFISLVLCKSLTPVIYIFFPVLIFGHSKRQNPYLLTIILTFLFLWAGTTFAYLNFLNWEGLDNAFSRLSGILIPLMWMYVFQSKIWLSVKFLFPQKQQNLSSK